MKNDLDVFLRSRRSIRQFRSEVVEQAVIQRIITTATYAPSAHDKQPWRFVVVSTPEARKRLVEAITQKFRIDMTADGVDESEIAERVERTARRTREAPVVIVLCQDLAQVHPQSDENRKQIEVKMGAQSVALAGLQLLLAAQSEGLAGTWICWPLFAPHETCNALDIPVSWEPQGMIFLGFSSEKPDAPKRKPLAEIMVER